MFSYLCLSVYLRDHFLSPSLTGLGISDSNEAFLGKLKKRVFHEESLIMLLIHKRFLSHNTFKLIMIVLAEITCNEICPVCISTSLL